MFFRKDPTEVAIKNAFGVDIAHLYQKSKGTDEYICLALSTALKMTKMFPISTPFLQPLVKEELESFMGTSSISKTKLALISAGASTYERWNLTSTPVPSRLKRLKYVPPGWRMDALSGIRFWMASLIGQPAPVRAWLIELYTSAAALSWDAAVKIEASLDAPVPALPFALQALALNGLSHGLRHKGKSLPYGLKLAIPIALGGYSEGIADDIWGKIIYKSAGPILPRYYDTLASLWNVKDHPHLELLGIECGAHVLLSSNTEIATLMTISADFGERYAERFDSVWEENLMRNEPLVFSGIFSGF